MSSIRGLQQAPQAVDMVSVVAHVPDGSAQQLARAPEFAVHAHHQLVTGQQWQTAI
jgi:hypothetical protein